MINEKFFDMFGYIIINVQLVYSIYKFIVCVYLNNLFDVLGYNLYYCGGYINQIDLCNFLVVIFYYF